MENVRIMKRLQALDNLDKDSPDVVFTQVSLFLLVTSDLLEQIPIVCVLHNDTIQTHSTLVTD